MAYLWVWNKGNKLDPIYAKLIKDVQPGGVLLSPRSGSAQDVGGLRSYIKEINGIYPKDSLVPLIGADYLSLSKDKTNIQLGVGTNLSFDLIKEFDQLGH